MVVNKILSIDPGKEKCGLLLADIDKNFVLESKVVKTSKILDIILFWFKTYSFNLILIGNGTTSKYLHSEISSLKISAIKFVDEKGSTLRARRRYWEIYPPGCLFRFIPKEMLFPPKNLDAIVALILLEDYLNRKLHITDKDNIRS